MSEEELRKEAVRRRQAGKSAEEIAAALGRTGRWARKWSARTDEETTNLTWAKGRSRAPHTSPSRTPDHLRQAILDARGRLVANPRAQYGPLAVAGELRRMGVSPIPPRWTIERVIAAAGLSRPRRRPAGPCHRTPPGEEMSRSSLEPKSRIAWPVSVGTRRRLPGGTAELGTSVANGAGRCWEPSMSSAPFDLEESRAGATGRP